MKLLKHIEQLTSSSEKDQDSKEEREKQMIREDSINSLNLSKYLSRLSETKLMYVWKGVDAQVSQPWSLKSSGRPEALISRPLNPKYRSVSLSIMPMWCRRLTQMLLQDRVVNSSTKRLLKFSSQWRSDSMKIKLTSNLFLPIYKKAKWKRDPISSSNNP